ncbi:MAG: S9 family peptidase [Candidatus Aminicenantes bacterium]|nr:S9 family peptidase [Candidatus Aminicenantes bacterium]
MTKAKLAALLALAGAAAFLEAQSRPGGASASSWIPSEAEARLRAVYERNEFASRPFRAVWLPDGSGYTALETSAGEQAGPGERELVRYDAADGQRTILASLARLTPSGGKTSLAVDGYAISPDGRLVLIETNGRPDGDSDRRVADLWALDLPSGALRKVVESVSPGISRNAFSPDGKRILCLIRGNLHVCDLGPGTGGPSVALTAGGVAGTLANGGASWSPDGRSVAFVQTDSSAVNERAMLLPTDPSYPKVRNVRFARVGTTIPTLRVGVIAADRSGPVRWVALPAAAAGFYLGEVSWAGGSEELLIEWLSRGRDTRDFLLADIRTGAVKTIWHETDPAWFDASYRANAGLDWLRGGREFLVLSEKDGWRHAYVVSRDGSNERLLTPGANDIIAKARVDEAGGHFYYFASPDNATQRYLYRVRLDGKGKAERVTPADQPGSHAYDFSPDSRWAFHTFSTFDSPPATEIVRLPDHGRIRVLEDNRALRERVAALIPRPTEFFKLAAGGGVVMDAWMIKPRDFDPARKYPVFVFVYGEPHGQTVLDDWSGGQGHSLFHRAVADLGYLVVSMDNRGTPAPKGAAWRRAIFPSLGPLSTEEQAAGLLELGRTRPYVDLSRVGIWGWSGGGSNTLNAMFRKPGLYHVGIAVAPKPQPDLYNAWFQEIFMRTREENPEGYAKSAPIHFAEGLAGDLLIVHGTGETNTHVQITEGLVDRLIELGKRFDYMSYPNRDHNLREGKGTTIHLRMLIVRYLLDHLPAGPR